MPCLSPAAVSEHLQLGSESGVRRLSLTHGQELPGQGPWQHFLGLWGQQGLVGLVTGRAGLLADLNMNQGAPPGVNLGLLCASPSWSPAQGWTQSAHPEDPSGPLRLEGDLQWSLQVAFLLSSLGLCSWRGGRWADRAWCL